MDANRRSLWGGDPHTQKTARLIGGVAVLLLGVLFLLDSLDVLRARDYIRLWPVALIAMGIAHIVNARTPARVTVGLIWIGIGSAILSSNLRVFGLLWPLLLVSVGAYIVWQAFTSGKTLQAAESPGSGPGTPGSSAGTPASDPTSTLSGIAVLSGIDRKITSGAFRGGEVTTFMGGGKVDLRGASLAGGRAVIDVFAVMGGIELFVPDTWRVVIEAVPVLGAVEDKTRAPAAALAESAPCLILRGFVMMGGVEIKN